MGSLAGGADDAGRRPQAGQTSLRRGHPACMEITWRSPGGVGGRLGGHRTRPYQTVRVISRVRRTWSPACGCVPERAGTRVDPHVVDVARSGLEEDQVAGAAGPGRDVHGGGVLLGSGAGQALSHPGVDPHGQAGAVEPARPDRAPLVRRPPPGGRDANGSGPAPAERLGRAGLSRHGGDARPGGRRGDGGDAGQADGDHQDDDEAAEQGGGHAGSTKQRVHGGGSRDRLRGMTCRVREPVFPARATPCPGDTASAAGFTPSGRQPPSHTARVHRSCHELARSRTGLTRWQDSASWQRPSALCGEAGS